MQAEKGKDSQEQDTHVERAGLEEGGPTQEMAGGCWELQHRVSGWKVIGNDVGKLGPCRMGREGKTFGFDPVENGIIIR